MGYEVFKRARVRVEEPTLTLVPDGRIAINAAALRILREASVKSVLLLYDKSHKKIALKAALKADKDAFAVTATRTSSGSIRAKSFLSYVAWSARKRETFPATWNEKEKMLEIVLSGPKSA